MMSNQLMYKAAGDEPFLGMGKVLKKDYVESHFQSKYTWQYTVMSQKVSIFPTVHYLIISMSHKHNDDVPSWFNH